SRGATSCGGCGPAVTSRSETSCGHSCEPLTPVEILPRRGQHLGLRLGERALERRPRGFAVSPTAESVRQLSHVHVAERAEADLHLAIGELAEQEGQADARDGSRILDDAVQLVGGGTVPLQRFRRYRHPRRPELRPALALRADHMLVAYG